MLNGLFKQLYLLESCSCLCFGLKPLDFSMKLTQKFILLQKWKSFKVKNHKIIVYTEMNKKSE